METSTTITLPSSAPPWVRTVRGLRFECQRCARCCTGPGFIQLAPGEAARLAEHLGMELALFHARFVTQRGSDRIELAPRQPCPFLRESGCVVQEIKPLQCRCWPFFPTVLADPSHWWETALQCRGIARGRVHSIQEVETALAAMRALLTHGEV